MENNEKRNDLARREGRHYGIFDPWFDDFFPLDNRSASVMKTDIKEEDKDYVLSVEVPGIEKDQIHLALEDGYLNISTSENHSNDEKDKNGKYIRRERFSGSYERSFYVGDVKESDIHAKLNNGVLTVTIPKEAPKAENRTISIE